MLQTDTYLDPITTTTDRPNNSNTYKRVAVFWGLMYLLISASIISQLCIWRCVNVIFLAGVISSPLQ